MRATPREVCFKLKENFKLNQIQKSVLVGTLLGDGGIRYRGKDARLHIKHSARQLPLVEYKRSIFADITTMSVRVFKQKVGKVDYNFAEFVTLTHPEFTVFYRLFYPNSKKIIPNNIQALLSDPLSLAVWIMDDGSAEYAGLSIQTHSFTKTEVDFLRDAISFNFNIKTLSRMNKGNWVIYFPKASLPRLKSLIGKHMLKEFSYKLVPYSRREANPVETVRRVPIKSGYDIVRSA